MPTPALKLGRCSGAGQQRLQTITEQTRLLWRQHRWQQQRRLAAAGLGQHQAGLRTTQGIEVTRQRLLLIKEVLHQLAAFITGFNPAQQQLREGAKGCQGVAHLMHQQIALTPLPLQLALPALLLQVQQQGLSQHLGRALQAPIEGLWPLPQRAIHPQRANHSGLLPHRQPPARLLGS